MICVSVLADTNRKALGMIKKAFAVAEMAEVRIDRIPTPDLRAIVAARNGMLIVTNRCRREGGHFAGSERDRVGLLGEAVRLGADFVDIEASADRSLVGDLAAEISARRGKTKMIVSNHVFSETPSLRSLLRRLDSCRALGADVVKIVTRARSAEDNLRVLQLIPHSLAEGQPIAAFCMGPKGKISRVLAPLFGSCISYASLGKGSESAPGQLRVSEMRRAWRVLAGNDPGFESSDTLLSLPEPRPRPKRRRY